MIYTRGTHRVIVQKHYTWITNHYVRYKYKLRITHEFTQVLLQYTSCIDLTWSHKQKNYNNSCKRGKGKGLCQDVGEDTLLNGLVMCLNSFTASYAHRITFLHTGKEKSY